MVVLAICLSALISYLLGSFNSAVIVVRLFEHKDIREYGSKNAGLTNVLRCFGKKHAIFTLIGDLLKGILSVLIAKGICVLLDAGLTAESDIRYIGFMAAIFAVLGHVYPLYFHFKGGKGVLVGAASLIAIDWRLFVILIVIFVILVCITKYISVGSIVSAGLLPFVNFGLQMLGRDGLPMWYIWMNTLLSACIGIWIICMHHANISRLRQGTENKFSIHK